MLQSILFLFLSHKCIYLQKKCIISFIKLTKNFKFKMTINIYRKRTYIENDFVIYHIKNLLQWIRFVSRVILSIHAGRLLEDDKQIHYAQKCRRSVQENGEEDLDGEVRVMGCILRFSPFIYAKCRLRLPSPELFVLLRRLCVRERVFVNLFCTNIHLSTQSTLLPPTT